MAVANIVRVWRRRRRTNIAFRVGATEYITSVPTASLAGLTGPQIREAIRQAAAAEYAAAEDAPQDVAGITGTIEV